MFQDSSSKVVSWSEGGADGSSVYPQEPAAVNGFDWQRLLGLNLEEDRSCTTKMKEVPLKELPDGEVSLCRPTHITVHRDDDLGKLEKGL